MNRKPWYTTKAAADGSGPVPIVSTTAGPLEGAGVRRGEENC